MSSEISGTSPTSGNAPTTGNAPASGGSVDPFTPMLSGVTLAPPGKNAVHMNVNVTGGNVTGIDGTTQSSGVPGAVGALDTQSSAADIAYMQQFYTDIKTAIGQTYSDTDPNNPMIPTTQAFINQLEHLLAAGSTIGLSTGQAAQVQSHQNLASTGTVGGTNTEIVQQSALFATTEDPQSEPSTTDADFPSIQTTSGPITSGQEAGDTTAAAPTNSAPAAQPSRGNLWLAGGPYVALLIATMDVVRSQTAAMAMQTIIEQTQMNTIVSLAEDTAQQIKKAAEEQYTMHVACAAAAGCAMGVSLFAGGMGAFSGVRSVGKQNAAMRDMNSGTKLQVPGKPARLPENPSEVNPTRNPAQQKYINQHNQNNPQDQIGTQTHARNKTLNAENEAKYNADMQKYSQLHSFAGEKGKGWATSQTFFLALGQISQSAQAMAQNIAQSAADIPVAEAEGQKQRNEAASQIAKTLLDSTIQAFHSNNDQIAQLLQTMTQIFEARMQAIAAMLSVSSK